MSDRRSEKTGWFGGFLGGFLAVLILSVIALFREKTLAASIGLIIFALACGAAWFFAPWRHPRTRYRLLLVPYYVLLLAAIGWAAWAFTARELGLSVSWWSLYPLVVALLPLWTMGRQRWIDRETKQPGSEHY